MMDERQQLLLEWLKGVLGTDAFSCEPASSDASFRRYFRVILNEQSFVVMDAPPEKEDCTSFISIAKLLVENGIHAPEIFHLSEEKGFMVLSDLGSISYLDQLTDATANGLYFDAVQALHKMHRLPVGELSLPQYDLSLLQQEMGLFKEWFVEKLLAIDLSPIEEEKLAGVQMALAQSALSQTQVFVHRDYHSRNLMVTEVNNPGVIDFQDAVVGPMTYDLVSLFRDCYISWSDEKVYAWLDGFLQQRQTDGYTCDVGKERFYQWFDWMGVQRHLKVLGIFSRLLLRDGKAGYLKDIPLTLAYVVGVCRRYDELKPLLEIIEGHQIEKKFAQRQQEYLA